MLSCRRAVVLSERAPRAERKKEELSAGPRPWSVVEVVLNLEFDIFGFVWDLGF